MKYLGLDLGSRTCGVAISDSYSFLARTYTTIRFRDDNYQYCLEEVLKICEKEGVTKIVLGLPKHMNGDLGDRANISIDFKKMIEEKNNNIEVILWDERLTTVVVDRAMISCNVNRKKRHEKKDELAAVVILEDYLNYKNKGA